MNPFRRLGTKCRMLIVKLTRPRIQSKDSLMTTRSCTWKMSRSREIFRFLSTRMKTIKRKINKSKRASEINFNKCKKIAKQTNKALKKNKRVFLTISIEKYRTRFKSDNRKKLCCPTPCRRWRSMRTKRIHQMGSSSKLFKTLRKIKRNLRLTWFHSKIRLTSSITSTKSSKVSTRNYNSRWPRSKNKCS